MKIGFSFIIITGLYYNSHNEFWKIMQQYKEIRTMITLNTEIFSQFNDRWALLSAGPAEHHNTMTVSWGGMGTLWGRPVVTVYIRPERYTYQFMNQYDFFTVSFFPEQYRDALSLMGSCSGRDTDKEAAAGLTVRDLGKAVSYEGAETVLLCKKIYWQDLDVEHMPAEIVRSRYAGEAPHRLFIGEVTDII